MDAKCRHIGGRVSSAPTCIRPCSVPSSGSIVQYTVWFRGDGHAVSTLLGLGAVPSNSVLVVRSLLLLFELRQVLTVFAEILWLCQGSLRILEVNLLDVEVLGWCGYT